MTLAAIEQFCDVLARATTLTADLPILASIGIGEVGLTHASGRWCFVRPVPSFGLVLVTIEGTGEVLVDGTWTAIQPETAYLMPPQRAHGYRVAASAESWRYVWLRLTSAPPTWLVTQDAAHLMPAPSYAVHAAVQGLIAERQRGSDPVLTGLWAELVQAALRHLLRPAACDPRLARLWAEVERRLGEPWDLKRLAEHAHLSREHLRRLCQRGYGCSPHQQVMSLRLRRACDLLVHGDLTLSGIAERIGFSDGFILSQAFKREYGLAPSAYRKQARREAASTGLA